MINSWFSGASILIFVAVSLGPPCRAAEPPSPHGPAKNVAGISAVQRLGGFGQWSAYLYKEKSGRVCYLAGAPRKTEPARFRRRSPTAMVTHRPQENVANVISFNEGAPLKEGSDAGLEVDGTHFDLFTKGGTAWSRTSGLDRMIVEAMAKGRQAILRATPERGPAITDTYSLSGFAQTLALIDKACSIRR